MKGLTRRENLAGKLTFVLMFFPVLVFFHGAYPPDQKLVKEDGIEYRAADSVSDDAFKRARFVVQQMTAESPKSVKKWWPSGSKWKLSEKIKFSAISPITLISKARRRAT